MSTSETPFDPAFTDTLELEEDDWDDAPITPRSRIPRLTRALVVLVIVAAAFAGGVFAQRQWGVTSSGSATGTGGSLTGAAGSGAQSSRRFGAGGANAFGGGGVTAGQVAYLKGRTLYVTDATGNTVKVAVPKGVPVTTSVTTGVGAIKPGDTVVVRGRKAANGTVSAESVSIGGAGALFSASAGGSGGATGSGSGTGSGSSAGANAPTGFGGAGG